MFCSSAMVAAAAVSLISHVTAMPQFVSNMTTAMAPAPTGCSNSCQIGGPPIDVWTWRAFTYTTTMTAATVVHIVNKRTNATRTSTILNTDIETSLGVPTPDSTNAMGTNVASITGYNPRNGGSFTQWLTYPTPNANYPTWYTWSGTLQTTVSGTSTCLIESTASTGFLSTARSQSAPVPTPDPSDPRGLHYSIDQAFACDFWEYMKRDWYPDVGAMQACNTPANIGCTAGEATWNAALFVTVTSTSNEVSADSVPTAAAAPLSGLSPTLAGATSTRPAVTAAPQPQAASSADAQLPRSTAAALTFPDASAPSPVESPTAEAVSQVLVVGSLTSAIAAPSQSGDGQAGFSPAPASVQSPAAESASGATSQVDNPDTAASVTNANPPPMTPAAPSPQSFVSASVIALGSSSITADSAGNFAIQGQTLTPGGGAITVAGTPISLGPAPATAASQPGGLPPLMIGTASYIAASDSAYDIGGATLAPGGPPVTVSGTPLSLANGASYVLVGSSTVGLAPVATSYSLASGSGASSGPAPPQLITLGTSVLTASALTEYVAGSVTLIASGGSFILPSAQSSSGSSASVQQTLTAPSSATSAVSAGGQHSGTASATSKTGGAARSFGVRGLWTRGVAPFALAVLVLL